MLEFKCNKSDLLLLLKIVFLLLAVFAYRECFLHGPISIKASSMRITEDLLTFTSFHEQKE